MDIILKIIEFIGTIAIFGSIIILGRLQINLSRKYKKSIFTSFDVLYYPKEKMSEREIFSRKIGGVLFLIGSLLTIILAVAT